MIAQLGKRHAEQAGRSALQLLVLTLFGQAQRPLPNLDRLRGTKNALHLWLRGRGKRGGKRANHEHAHVWDATDRIEMR